MKRAANQPPLTSPPAPVAAQAVVARPVAAAAAQAPTSRRFRDEVLPCLVLLVLAFAAYIPALAGEFVFDDNHLYILYNPVVQADDGLYRIWFTTEPVDFYPLTHTTYWFEWRIWEKNTIGYHCFNCLLHGATGCVLWYLLRRLGIGWAWLIAAVFVLHPVNVQTVAWISQRKSLLAALFGFWSLYCYVRFDVERKQNWYYAAIALCAVAHMGKSSMLMMPFAMVGYHLWKYGKLQRRDVSALVPFFLLTLAFGYGGHWFMQNRGLGHKAMREDNFFGRAATAGWAVWFYVYKSLVPTNLTLMYPKWRVNPWVLSVYVPGLMLVLIAGLCYRARATWGKPILAACGFFLITMFPVLGFFDVGHFQFSLVADHYVYQSLPAILALVFGTAAYYCGEKFSRTGLARAGAVGLVALLFALTWQQSKIWASSEILWSDTIAKNPGSAISYMYMADARFKEKRFEESMSYAQQAREIEPDWVEPPLCIGFCLGQLGRNDEAEKWYLKAIELAPEKPDGYVNLANIYRKPHPKAAIELYKKAVELEPKCAEAHNNLGALWARNNPDDARRAYERALEIDPKYADALSNYGTLLARQGRIETAIEYYTRALAIKPDHPEASRNLETLTKQMPPRRGNG